MLEEIRIRGLGVISDAVLEFGPGLTVVTGETGAGKTMVVTGLSLLFGGRADASRLRAGVDSASVEGRLLLDPQAANSAAVAEVVTEAGGDVDDDGSLVLRRVVSAAGRSRAAAGGAAVPVSVLARLADRLLALHGQSDQQRLTQAAAQRDTLDRAAGLSTEACRTAFEAWQRAARELHRRQSDARELAREAELLRFGLAEIAAVAPEPGEDRALAEVSARLQYADELRVAARTAHTALLGDPDDPVADAADVATLLAVARRALGQIVGTDSELDAVADRLATLAAGTADIGADLANYEGRLDADPARLAAVHERRAALSGLTRKYGADVDAVLQWAAQAEQQLAEADTSDDALAGLAAARNAAAAEFAAAATALSRARSTAAETLSSRITAELGGLGMPAAVVRFEVRPRAASASGPTVQLDGQPFGAAADGIDEIELTLQPHPDAPALPVQRGASGGELSRVMLAIEVVLAGSDPVPTMIFDEVDAGVGGRAAVEIGRRLGRLAADHQVIVVTHLAQVAAFADRHLVVDKSVAGPLEQAAADGAPTGITRSDIRHVEGPQRSAELARMLSGADTPVARQHAEELLAAAAVARAADAQQKARDAGTPTAEPPAADAHTADTPTADAHTADTPTAGLPTKAKPARAPAKRAARKPVAAAAVPPNRRHRSVGPPASGR